MFDRADDVTPEALEALAEATPLGAPAPEVVAGLRRLLGALDPTAAAFSYALVGCWDAVAGWGTGRALRIDDHPRTDPHEARHGRFVGWFEGGVANGVVHDLREIAPDVHAYWWSQVIWSVRAGVLIGGVGLLWRSDDGDREGVRGLMARAAGQDADAEMIGGITLRRRHDGT